MTVRSLLILLFTIFVCTAEASTGVPHSTVQELTDETFDEALSDPANGLWFLKFYAPWCGHCQKMSPMLDKVARFVEGKMAIGKVDCTKYNKVCKRFDVKGFPTLKFYRDGDFYDYPGERNADSIIEFAEKMSVNAVERVSTSSAAYEIAGAHRDGVAFVAYDPNAKGSTLEEILFSTTLMQVFKQVARKQQAYASFAILLPGTPIEEIEKLNIGRATEPFIAKIEKDVDSKPYRGEMSTQEVLTFVKSNNIGLVTPLGAHNFRSIGNKGKPLVIGVMDPDDDSYGQSTKLLSRLKEFARDGPTELTNKYYFCWMDGKKWEKFVGQFHITKDNMPEYFVLDVPSRIFWQNSTLQSNMKDFLEAVASGKIPPQRQDGGTGNRFIDAIKDFFMMFRQAIMDNLPWSIVLLALPPISIILSNYIMKDGDDDDFDEKISEEITEKESESKKEK